MDTHLLPCMRRGGSHIRTFEAAAARRSSARIVLPVAPALTFERRRQLLSVLCIAAVLCGVGLPAPLQQREAMKSCLYRLHMAPHLTCCSLRVPQVLQVYEDALAQDASVFDYDGVYDSLQEQRVQPKQQEKIERKSRCGGRGGQAGMGKGGQRMCTRLCCSGAAW